MRHVICIVTLMALAGPAPLAAQSETPPQDGMRGLLDELLRDLAPSLDELQGLAEDMRPALRDFMRSMGPALNDMLETVEDWSRYDPPVILPNGDILIRRRPAGTLPPDTPDRNTPEPTEPKVTDPIEL